MCLQMKLLHSLSVIHYCADQEGLSRTHPRQTELEGWPQKGRQCEEENWQKSQDAAQGVFMQPRYLDVWKNITELG